MKKNKNPRLILVLSLFLISYITCSLDTLNLQQDERYILRLDAYYDFIASQIDFPTGQLPENTIFPYKEIGQQTESPIISSITNYQENQNSKYFIGYSKKNMKESCFDAQITYFHLEVMQGVLSRTQLASLTLFSTCAQDVSISASFYSSTNGFISYNIDSQSLTFHFSYSQDKGLTIIKLENTFQIDNLVAVLGSGNIYIMCVHKVTFGLLKYNSGENTLEKIDSYNMNDLVSQNIVVDPTHTIFGFDSDQKILYSFFIDYSKEKLLINKQKLPELTSSYTLKSIQRYKHILILTLTNYRQSAIVKLKKQAYIEEGVFSVDEITQIQLQIEYNSIFIDYNILVLYNNQSFLMINTQKQQVIFQQTLDQNHIVDINQFIDNQFIVQLTKNNDQGKAVTINYSAQLSNPSLIITAATNTKLEFTIYQVDRSYSQTVQITINITNELKTTLTQNSIQLADIIPSLTYDYYQIPVEKYIIGSNFNPQISVGENNFIRNAKLVRVIQLQQSDSLQINNIQNTYQTDGLISSIITSKTGNKYSIFAAVPQISGNQIQTGEVFLYSTSSQLSSPIGIIDSYGSFIFQSDLGTQSFTIYVPFMIRKTRLFYNTITKTCSKTNFAFASDIQNNILFIMCGQLIEQFDYQFNDIGGQLIISSQKELIFDSSQFINLICIQGNLFIYNDLSIAAYDYFANSHVGNPIQIPQLQTNQKIIIFRESFLISYNLKEKLTISLYSYGQFQREKAIFVRNLIQGQPSQSNLSIIPKRNIIEYLYVSTGIQNEYSLFKINNVYSQNQFYTTITIATDKYNVPVISQDLVCIIGSDQQVQCQQILKEATLSYQLQQLNSNFYQNLIFTSLVTLSFQDQQQQQYEIQILRDGSQKYAILDKSAQSLQKLRTEIQDTQISKGTTFYFNDQQITHSCINGWSTNYFDIEIINRLKIEQSQNSISIFTILYNQQAILESNQIIIGRNLLQIKRDNSQTCTTILDDSGSRIQVDAQSFQQNIFLICEDKLINYIIQFTTDNNGSITKAVLVDQILSQFDSHINSKQFKRFVSFKSKAWLQNSSINERFQIVQKNDSFNLKIVPFKIELTSPISINIISRLSLNLQFFRSGLILVENVDKDKHIKYSYSNLKDLLQKVNFIVGENDQIEIVNQYSDSKFRIQFAYSYIYDITFSLDKNNQIAIERASSYYYIGTFNYLALGISSNQYTILVGFKDDGLYAALYNNQNSMQNQYVIQSQILIKSKNVDQDQFYVTYAEVIRQNQFAFYFSNGGSISIEVSDNVGIQFLQDAKYFENLKILIFPIGSQYYDSWISLQVSSVIDNPPSPSSQLRNIFSLSIFIILSLLQI